MDRIIFVKFLFVLMVSIGDVKALDIASDNGYVEPFRLFDNVFYVGDKWVSSYVVETSVGLVIIDTLEFPYSKWIPDNLKKLGLEDKAVSHILITHGHSDHVGGAQFLQKLYKAKVIITKKGYELALEQSKSSSGNKAFLPPSVSEFAQDGSILVVGDSAFKLYITPGHTEGDMSIDFMAKDRGKLYRAFVVGGHGTNFQYPELAKQFIASMDRIEQLSSQKPVVSVNLSNHPHKNNLFEKRDLRTRNGIVNAFVDKENFIRFVKHQKTLAKEKLDE